MLALAFAAGYIDAVSYLGLSRVFTANMTGNTVLLGIALAQLDGDAAARSGLALAGFLAGAAAGAWIVERDHSQGLWPRAVTLALGRTVNEDRSSGTVPCWLSFGSCTSAVRQRPPRIFSWLRCLRSRCRSC